MKTNKEKELKFQQEQEIIAKLKQENLYERYNQMKRMGKNLFMDFCTGRSLKALTYDKIFKKIFDSEEHRGRLEHFLTAMLGFRVTVVKVFPVESTRILEAGSVLIMDILVKSEEGNIINVEMQKSPYKFTGERESCYLSDLIMRQYNSVRAQSREENKDFSYRMMRPVYSIIFLENSYYDFRCFPDCWRHNGNISFDTGLKVNFLENITYVLLDNFREIEQNIDTEEKKWVYLLSADTPERIANAAAMSAEFFDIIYDIAIFATDIRRVMDMFSEALYMMDRNTEKLMLDETLDRIKEAEKELDVLKVKKCEAEERIRKAEERKREAEEKKQEAEEKKREAEERKREAEEKEREAEEKAKRAGIQAQMAEEKARRMEDEKEKAELNQKVFQMLFRNMSEEEISKNLGVSIEYIEELKNAAI